MTTGEVIKALRRKHKLTQEELGDILGVKKSAIQKYENGSINNLKFDLIRKLCIYFKIPPWIIIFPETTKIENLEKTTQFDFTKIQYLNDQGKIKIADYISDILLIEKYVYREK